jgi:hypothetical protein
MACWPNQFAGPSGPPGLAKPTGSGLGRSNRPSPAPFAPSLSLVVPLAIWFAAAIAWPLRPSPVAIAVATLGKSLATAPSTSSTKWFRRPLPTWGDRIGPPPQDLSPLSTPAAVPHRAGACWASSGACAWCELAGASWWRPPQAASGWPRRHCPAMPPRRAPGRLVSFFFPLYPLLFLLAMVFDHTGQDQWAKLTELAQWCCCWMYGWFS